METLPGEFERLRRLLALKRYERPPAGCLDEMRQTVLARLRQEQQSRAAQPAAHPVPWWHMLKEALAPRPLWVGLVGVGVCALVISAIWQAEQFQLPGGLEGAAVRPMEVPTTRVAWPSSAMPGFGDMTEPHRLLAATNVPLNANPSFAPAIAPGSLFAPPLLDVQRASSAPPATGTISLP